MLNLYLAFKLQPKISTFYAAVKYKSLEGHGSLFKRTQKAAKISVPIVMSSAIQGLLPPLEQYGSLKIEI